MITQLDRIKNILRFIKKKEWRLVSREWQYIGEKLFKGYATDELWNLDDNLIDFIDL